MKVYSAIGAVTAALSVGGIAKGRKNTQQGYNFRGIDEVLNALSGELVAAGLVVLPRVVERTTTERATKTGGALFYVTVKVDFDLVAIEDGSKHTVTTYGEAMDSADKATNKAMSAAYKYMALQAFCIPTEGTPDADEQTHEVAAQRTQPAPRAPAPARAPAREAQGESPADVMLASLRGAAMSGMAKLRALYDQINATGDVAILDAVWLAHQKSLKAAALGADKTAAAAVAAAAKRNHQPEGEPA